jgi:transcription elongation factor Elf1
VLTLICPFCQHGHTDDLECLDSGRLDTLHCENAQCGKDFKFLIRECLACGEESVFTWTRRPAPEALAGLCCQHCGAQLDEAAPQGESEDAAQRI